ncbi:preprotein translocase subunit SecA [Allonocardiopsis opalescens]|uniref:Protein translocase subunit SecA n=1 Tax=Allonocardiopsis opalescens TaxID=1144618 RepID=A0A2T0QCE5_9ACTN|nr:preprotein translocase subunit SecA [Allonocardiopsis opalescens]PRY01523.1 protein translocase subunit secA [Allonocardiopsis opalescens]
MPVLLDKLLRAGEGKILRRLKRIAQQVNSIEDDFVDLSDADLRAETDKFKQRYADGESLDDLMYEAFAVVREAAKRTLGQRHYDVQIMGGAALHLGNIAEMRTGEGKTLTSALAAYLNALAGNGVHVVTTNDYLAKRDAAWMGRIYQFLGLKVDVIHPEIKAERRREAYLADITYGTNNEFGFDYLRDNMAWSLKDTVQRGHHFAIVDEVDSILIDEARTPLIISGPAEQNSKWFGEFAKIVPRLRRDVDYEVDEKKRTVGVLEAGVEKVEDLLGIDNLYDSANTTLVSFLNNAIKAKELYHKDKEYIVRDGEVLIVDEFTGRVLAGRRYNEGMHQAIEAKEKVKIKDENQTLAKITLQNYFRLYEKLAGMTGTAMTEANEFHQTYKLGVVPIPTNKPNARTDERDVVYKTEEAKFEAVVDDIVDCQERGQPVLIGTTSVEKSEMLSQMLRRKGVEHEVLNAKNHAREASIVARAGRKGAVTVATNMAGRGTDIMLGGNPDVIADEELQARGLNPLEAAEEYEAAWPEALEKAKQAVEAEHEEVVEAGGLYVLGTERHESRRIDNQLRGRSGRQGDPGQSRFYLSLQDDLMRLFNSARVEIIMQRLNIPDDQPIESGVVSKAIQSAQGQREQQHFEIRKDVLKYDEVLNLQRKVIYAERRKVLEGADLHEQVRSMIDDALSGYVAAATAEGDADDWDFDKLWKAFKQLYPIGFTIDDLLDEFDGDTTKLTTESITTKVLADAQAAYDRREEQLGAETMRELERQVVLSVLDRKWREHLYEMDYLQQGIGLRAMAQRDPLIEYQREGYDMFTAMLEAIKEESVGHLFNAEVKRRSEPAAPKLTAASAAAAARTAAGGVLTDAAAAPDTAAAGGTPAAEPAAAADDEDADTDTDDEIVVAGLSRSQPTRLNYTAPTVDGEGGVERHSETVEDDMEKVPRNAPCPCGSGKKFKRCHGDPKNRVS